MIVYFKYECPIETDELDVTKMINIRKVNRDSLTVEILTQIDLEGNYYSENIGYFEAYIDMDKTIRHESNYEVYDMLMKHIKTELRKQKLERLVK